MASSGSSGSGRDLRQKARYGGGKVEDSYESGWVKKNTEISVCNGRLSLIKKDLQGHLGGSMVEHLPLAQGVIPGSWDRVPHQVPHREPASSSAYVSVSLSVSLMNKKKTLTIKKKNLPFF